MPHGDFTHIEIPADDLERAKRFYGELFSIDETLPRVPDVGGTVLEEDREVPGMGWYAVIRDSEGNELGLWERISRS